MDYNLTNINTQTNYFSTQETATGSGIYFAGISWEPAPSVSMTVEKYTAGEHIIGGVMVINLNGVIHGTDFSNTANQVKSKIRSLASKNKCINDINIGCGSTNIIESGIGWIRGYSFPEGDQKTWANIVPYNIELVVLKSNGTQLVQPNSDIASHYVLNGKYIKSISENVSYSMDDKIWQSYSPSGVSSLNTNHYFSNEHILVKYNLQVQGLGGCSNCEQSGVTTGLKAADDVITAREANLQTIKEDTFLGCGSGVNVFPDHKYDTTKRYNHTRNVNVDELNGTISIDGEYIIRPSGVRGDVLITMDTNADSNIENGEKNITINGNIRGLVENTYTNISDLNAGIGKNAAAMTAAENRLYNIVNSDGDNIWKYIRNKNNLINFVSAVGDSDPEDLEHFNDGSSYGGSDAIAKEFRLLQKVFKRNHTNSSIDFTLTYSNKSRHKIPYALWAEMNIEHQMPARRLVEHVVPGRGYPLTQDILCDTLETYSVTVNAQLEPKKAVDHARSVSEHALIAINDWASDNDIDTWVRTADSESYANNGSYRRTVTFTRHSCYDGATTSSLLNHIRVQPPAYNNTEGTIAATEPSEPNIVDRDLSTPTSPKALP